MAERYKEIANKYKEELEKALGDKEETQNKSAEYLKFRQEMLPGHFNIYERFCNQAEKIIKIAPDKKTSESLQHDIDTCHLGATPTGVISLSILVPVAIIVLGALMSVVLPMLIGGSVGLVAIMFFMMIALASFFILTKVPSFFANSWRLRASNEMVLSIFYVVTYMRHTSNIENAIAFASEHLTGPLSLDLRKILWDLETEKFESVKESLDNYLMRWKETNMEFVEAFHLIESSLYEPGEDRRVSLLDKSLDVILEETYEKMMHYAYNLKNPITMLHMLGVIMPILGLVILPLIVSFMTGGDKPGDGFSSGEMGFYIALIYNVTIPLVVFYFGKKILSERPTGYGDTDLSAKENVKRYQNYEMKVGNSVIRFTPLMIAAALGIILLFIGLFPLILHAAMPDKDVVFDQPEGGSFIMSLDDKNYIDNVNFPLLGYRLSKRDGSTIGPYAMIAALFSLAIPLAFAFSFGLYYRTKTKKLMKVRENSKKLEEEFASALFQLGNRLGDGLPVEIAFEKVAKVMEGTISGNFFSTVANNISKFGMPVQQAIFDPKVGALSYYPSNLIESSMKVLVESSKKGPLIAASAVINVSRYIKEIHRVNERLRDLMEENVSSMKSQISFLAPVIAGVVIGITAMVTYILTKLSTRLGSLASGSDLGSIGSITKIFGDGMPTYTVQIIVGLYIVEIVYLLTILQNTIENGDDKLNEKYLVGKNLFYSLTLYAGISFVVMVLFTVIAASVLGRAI